MNNKNLILLILFLVASAYLFLSSRKMDKTKEILSSSQSPPVQMPRAANIPVQAPPIEETTPSTVAPNLSFQSPANGSITDLKEAIKKANPYSRLFRIAESYPYSREKNLLFSYGVRVAPATNQNIHQFAIANFNGFEFFEDKTVPDGTAKFYAVFDTVRNAAGAYTGRFAVETDRNLDPETLEKSQLVISETIPGVSNIYFIADLEDAPQVESLAIRISKLAGVKKYYPEVLWGRAQPQAGP